MSEEFKLTKKDDAAAIDILRDAMDEYWESVRLDISDDALFQVEELYRRVLAVHPYGEGDSPEWHIPTKGPRKHSRRSKEKRPHPEEKEEPMGNRLLVAQPIG